jgi:uncharacterized phage protein (TIGR01671 family)
MQREIKFRAWSTKYNRFLDCETSQFQHYIHGYSNPVDRNLNHKTITIQQFTGLLDENGKEIYEGDILQYTLSNSEFIGVVEWQNYGWVIQDFEYDSADTICGAYKASIIGNIFENPELLKV